MPPKDPGYVYYIPDLSDLSVEEKIQLALDAVRESFLPRTGKHRLSLRRAAKDFGVPRSTLTDRNNGIQTRADAHEHERRLSRAEEQLLSEWTKAQGRRGIPLSPTAIAEHAALIAGSPVGVSWVKRFVDRHPDLRSRYTTSLEQCRANNANPATVRHFYNVYEELVHKYNIADRNIYNMDEKGVQLGVGKRIGVIVDREQKNVPNLEDGNREMVTVIDISSSPNGWTDQDLGLKWLENDFEPKSLARMEEGDEYRMLILDGHNSHCTYRFAHFAETHKIIILCLPSHTTHVLQPCDVGVFGPLSTAWKNEVVLAGNKYVCIDKYSFLSHYSAARSRALKPDTIRSAWRKTGIVPFNPDALDPHVFAPSLNTTTQAAQPIGASLPSPSLIHVITTAPEPSLDPTPAIDPSDLTEAPPSTVPSSSNPSIVTEPSTESGSTLSSLPPVKFRLIIPKPVPHTASRSDLRLQNQELFRIVKAAECQIQRDHAQKRLMDAENARLRQRLFGKEKKKLDKRVTSEARHMTSDEVLSHLAYSDWTAGMKVMHSDEIFKAKMKRQKGIIDEYQKQLVDEERVRVDELKRITKAQKVVEELWRREMSNLVTGMEAVAVVDGKKVEKARKQAELIENRRLAQQRRKAQQTTQRRAVTEEPSDSDDTGTVSDSDSEDEPPPTPAPRRARPKARPVGRAALLMPNRAASSSNPAPIPVHPTSTAHSIEAPQQAPVETRRYQTRSNARAA